MTQRFEGKKVLILGGTSGIGLAAGRAFRSEGAKVAVLGRTAATVGTAAAEFDGLAFMGDIADVLVCRQAVTSAAEAMGGIDVLFVNAGVASVGRILDLTEEAWDECYAVNLRGAVFAIQAALPHMSDGGAIVTTGSIGSEMAIPSSLAYSSAKAALRSVTRVLAAELLPRRIRVNMVSLGPTKTELYKRAASPEVIETIEQRLAADTPQGRMADADEAARSVLFLASNEAAFTTGISLFVDGGIGELGTPRRK